MASEIGVKSDLTFCFEIVKTNRAMELQVTHELRLKRTVSAQKALQESETDTRELLGGTEENTLIFFMKEQL